MAEIFEIAASTGIPFLAIRKKGHKHFISFEEYKALEESDMDGRVKELRLVCNDLRGLVTFLLKSPKYQPMIWPEQKDQQEIESLLERSLEAIKR